MKPGVELPGSVPNDLTTALQAARGNLNGREDHRVHLENLLKSVPDHVYFKDRDSRFLAVSEAFARRHGMEPADLIGKTDHDLFSDAHAKPALEDEQRIIRTGEPIIDKLEKEHWPDGRVTYVLTSKMPLLSDAGDIIGTFGISKDVTSQKVAEAALEKTRRELVDASRTAGMAEVATGVLHNVGNVLVSINIATDSVVTAVRNSKIDLIPKITAMLREHEGDLAKFLSEDPKGRMLPVFLEQLSSYLAEDRRKMLAELESLRGHVAHVKDIVAMQQNYAKLAGATEPLEPRELVEDALRMNTAALARHEVAVIRDFQPSGLVLAERGKVLQILVNLIRNAKYACDESTSGHKEIALHIRPGAPGRVVIEVADTGVGIAPEHLGKLFNHGFTTKKDGHGFGLHSSANAAHAMNGSLTARSDGKGTGATFTLELPAAARPKTSEAQG